jgi:alpha-ketoglutaric semialdehyde dehydrogenase
MLKGYNLIGLTESNEGKEYLQSFSPVTQQKLPEQFTVATSKEVNTAVDKATAAFVVYKDKTAEDKAIFLETISEEIMALGDELIQRAMLETGLSEARLTGERARTTGQLKLFAQVLREGSWVEAVIDTALPERKPLSRPDMRKMLVPIGPVAVFGASNFPFAFSTAGGDTASALAGGNPVVVKAHESHLGTNELVASAINNAVKKCDMPDGVFSFVIGEGAVTGIQLVKHEGIKAIGFTGSYNAGMAIFKTAVNDRKTPIPVFAEMSSINPVLLLPGKLNKDENAAAQLAASVTLGAGQFCTNPGLLFLIEDEASEIFIKKLADVVSAAPAAAMLNPNICRSYYKGREVIAKQKGVHVLFEGEDASATYKGSAFLTKVSAADFISNTELQNEVFGPASLIVACKNKEDLLRALQSLHGQLTASVLALPNELPEYAKCINTLSGKVGRVVYNGVPTGVEVSYAMVHGGPYPATTNANSTSVGADAIKRFVRPLCLQDCPEDFLPVALKNNNPLNIMRKVNGEMTREGVVK